MVSGSCLGVSALRLTAVIGLLALVVFALVVEAAQANVGIVGCVGLLLSLCVLL